VLFTAMSLVWAAGVGITYAAEAAGNPLVHALGVSGGNWEGKDVRFGIPASALWAVTTTATSCGAVNAQHDSLMPLGGLIPMLNIQLGEDIFGGVGSGLYGMLEFVVLTVFIAGLMVGRTPEYLGKKIERREVQYAILALLVVPIFTLVPAALASVSKDGLATLGNNGAHGFSEILYAFTSATGNNGSAFGGLGGNTFYDFWTGVSMFFGRFAEIVAVVALAGALAGKKSVATTAGTFTTTSGIFVALLIGVILIVGALTFFPADALGPIVEQLQLNQGKVF
jgi:K+-transporting ATPase ATPase A chain